MHHFVVQLGQGMAFNISRGESSHYNQLVFVVAALISRDVFCHHSETKNHAGCSA